MDSTPIPQPPTASSKADMLVALPVPAAASAAASSGNSNSSYNNNTTTTSSFNRADAGSAIKLGRSFNGIVVTKSSASDLHIDEVMSAVPTPSSSPLAKSIISNATDFGSSRTELND